MKLKTLKFPKDYRKLDGLFFTTLRGPGKDLFVGEIVRCVSPTKSFKAKVIAKDIFCNHEIDSDFAFQDADCTVSEIRYFIMRQYKSLFTNRFFLMKLKFQPKG